MSKWVWEAGTSTLSEGRWAPVARIESRAKFSREPGFQQGSGQGTRDGDGKPDQTGFPFRGGWRRAPQAHAGQQSYRQSSSDPADRIAVEGVLEPAGNVDSMLELRNIHTQAITAQLAAAE